MSPTEQARPGEIQQDDGRPLADHERSRCTAGHVRQMAEEYDALLAENERLREALDRIADARMGAFASELRSIAQSALSGSDERG